MFFESPLVAGLLSRIDNADLHSAIGCPRFRGITANARVGFAKTFRADKARADPRLDQGIADSFGAADGEFQVVVLCATVIRISVYVNGISLERHQDACDALQDAAVLRCNVRFVSVEPDRLLSQRHHQPMWGAARFGDLPEGLF